MLPLSTIFPCDFRTVLTVWYFRTVLTVWYFRTVPTVWYFRTVPTVWYFIVFHFIIFHYEGECNFSIQYTCNLIVVNTITTMLEKVLVKQTNPSGANCLTSIFFHIEFMLFNPTLFVLYFCF